jgi:3-isopropylmalate/(R)-2-methylmalate dehydratase small subunit
MNHLNQNDLNNPMQLTGKCHLITDSQGNFINNIDTDMIFHNAHLAITDIKQMGKLAFGNLPGWQEFPTQVQIGNFLIVGENFGSGSSRQQAVDCFRSLGISAIIGISFGSIYKRNVINTGLPLIESDELKDRSLIQHGDKLEIDLAKSTIKNLTRNTILSFRKPFSSVQMDIYKAGGLFQMQSK